MSKGRGELRKAKVTEVSLLQEGRHHENKSNHEDDVEPGEPPSKSEIQHSWPEVSVFSDSLLPCW